MAGQVRFDDQIESLVRFVEETAPSEIVPLTLMKLRAGTPLQEMLIASALAVIRSSDLPSGHHGGPIHPLMALHGLHHIIERLVGELRFLPVLQHVALCNQHVHHPTMGPYLLPDFEPVDAGGIEATKRAFFTAVNRCEVNLADHYFLWLWKNIPAMEALDLLLTVAIPKNILDDHYFLFPVFVWRAVETLGQKYLSLFMRPAVRYVTRYPLPPAIGEIKTLLDRYQLLSRPLRRRTADDETSIVGHLGDEIGQCTVFSDIPVMIASKLYDGLSLEGAGEALSIGAAKLFLRSASGNPMDVHFHTNINARRYLMKLEGVSLRNRLCALLLWHSGPEVRLMQNGIETVGQPDPVGVLSDRTQNQLLDDIRLSICQQPPVNWSTVIHIKQLKAVPEVRIPVNLAKQYRKNGYDADALIDLLAEFVCQDNFTELHAVKHHQAMVEEFFSTRDSWRWIHLLAGVRAVSISYGKNKEIYEQAISMLNV